MLEQQLNEIVRDVEEQRREIMKFISEASKEEKQMLLSAWKYKRENPDKSAEECVAYAIDVVEGSGT